MARGGSRSGAGRPKAKVKQPPTAAVGRRKRTAAVKLPAGNVIKIAKQTPLEFALAIMNDPDEDKGRRDRMCAIAMPFVHPRAAEQGKKEIAKERAVEASKSGKYAVPPTPPKLVVNNS
jgi:hypothetical protein